MVTLVRRRTVIARLRRLVMIWGLLLGRIWVWSSSKTTSGTPCNRLSMCQWPRTAGPRSAGLAWWAASRGDGVGGLGVPASGQAAAALDLDRLGSGGEADAGADGDSLYGAGEDPAVAAVAGPCTDRYLICRAGR